MVFTRGEMKQLEKYVKGSKIEEEDRHFVEELQNVGMMKSPGFHREGKEVYETSRLTSLGYSVYLTSRTNHSKIRRFFSSLMNI